MLAGVTATWMIVTSTWIVTIPPCCATTPSQLLQSSGAAWAHLRRPGMHTRTGPALLALRQPEPPPPPPDQPEMPSVVVFAVAFLMSACFGVIAQVLRAAFALPAFCMHCTAHRMRTACHPQALPAALMRSGSSANAATTLGTLGSVSALVEVMLSNSFGKITDAIGRKPVLILAPALAVAARATVVVWPSLPVLLGARFCTTLVVPLLRLACACAPRVHRVCTACAPHVHCMCIACASRAHRMCIACAPHVQVPLFWLAFSSSLADLYGRSSTSLAIVNSRVAACMGLGYAVATLLGGKLSDVRRLLPRTDSNPNPNPSPNPNPDPNPHPHPHLSPSP